MQNKNLIMYRVKKGKGMYDIYIFDLSKPVFIFKNDPIHSFEFKFELTKEDYTKFRKMIKDKKIALSYLTEHQLSFLSKIILQNNSIITYSFTMERWKEIFKYLKEYSTGENKMLSIMHPIDYNCPKLKEIIDSVDERINSRLDLLIELTKQKD